MAEAQAATLESVKQRLTSVGGGQTAPSTLAASDYARRLKDVRERIRTYGVDRNFDQSGIRSYRLRATFSFLDSDKERALWLSKIVGANGWTQDKYGRYALTPYGQQRLGFKPKDKPILIDEPEPTLYDFADYAGSAPVILGATAVGMAATGLGAPAAIGLTMAGAALTKALQETVEQYAGINYQGLGEVAKDVAIEGAMAGVGEGFFRAIPRTIGRTMLAPERRRMTSESRQMVQEAGGLGVRLNVSQITRAPILGRIELMLHNVLGDPFVQKNSRAFTQELYRLRTTVGIKTTPLQSGLAVKEDISSSRKALARWASGSIAKIDELTGGGAFVPTVKLKVKAGEILDAIPRAADKTKIVDGKILDQYGNPLPMTLTERGEIVLADPALVKALGDIRKLPEELPLTQTQALIQRLYNAIGDETIVPGIYKRHAKELWKASTEMYDDISDPVTKGLVNKFRADYRNRIQDFDKAVVERLMKDETAAGFIEPEQVAGAIFKPKHSFRINAVKKVVSPETWAYVKRDSMDTLLGKYLARTDDPLDPFKFDGTALLKTLDEYGRDTISAMFGREISRDLYRLGKITQAASFKLRMSGGIVAANIALHPMKNLPRLIQMSILQRIMGSRWGIHWLTEGISAPKTRRGAEAIFRLQSYVMFMAREYTDGPIQPESQQAGATPPQGRSETPGPQGSPPQAGSLESGQLPLPQ